MKLERIIFVSISCMSFEVIKQRLKDLSGRVIKGIFFNLNFLEKDPEARFKVLMIYLRDAKPRAESE